MSQAASIYLGKESKTFGPYTAAQIEEMKRKGEYSSFSFIWTSQTPQWTPINAPPPPPVANVTASSIGVPPLAFSRPAAMVPNPASPVLENGRASKLQVICHNNREVLSGVIHQVTMTGCLLKSDELHATIPPFSNGSKVMLNILDEPSGTTENIEVALRNFTRSEGHWEFQIQWQRMPGLLAREFGI